MWWKLKVRQDVHIQNQVNLKTISNHWCAIQVILNEEKKLYEITWMVSRVSTLKVLNHGRFVQNVFNISRETIVQAINS